MQTKIVFCGGNDKDLWDGGILKKLKSILV
jgi:hypothetical protein